MKPPGVGLRILIDGGTQPQTESTPAIVPALPLAAPVTVIPARESDSELLTRLLAVLALVGADVGLLGWTAHHVLTHQGKLTALPLIACIGTVLLATLCGCAAARVATKA